jgi:DNA topoisomerase I
MNYEYLTDKDEVKKIYNNIIKKYNDMLNFEEINGGDDLYKEDELLMIGGDKMPSYDESHYAEGIRRVKKENSEDFDYFYNNNDKEINDSDLSRIKKLHIPTTWTNVWISQDPSFRIQVIGIDPNNKKQYLYTQEHKDAKKKEKYETLKKLIVLIPKINKILSNHLSKEPYDKLKVLATMLYIILLTGIRAGKEFYTKKNQTYGLCSLRKKHIVLDGENKNIIFKFNGKKNVIHEHLIHDSSTIYNELLQLMKIYLNPNDKEEDKLFNYKEGNIVIKLDEFDLNDYIHEYISKNIVIKDFRTYLANYLFVENLLKLTTKSDLNKTEIKKNIKDSIEITAKTIQHTPSICKSSYIYDEIIEIYKKNSKYFYNNKNKNIVDILIDILKLNQ